MDPAERPAPQSFPGVDELAELLHRRLIAEAVSGVAPGSRYDRVEELVARAAPLLDEAGSSCLRDAIERLACGLGPLEPLLADPDVDEILVMGTAPVFVERSGRLEVAGVRFTDETSLRGAIDRILGPAGRRVDESSPLCDARLPDGSRVNVVIPPLAVDGPVVTIRRFRAGGFSVGELIANGSVSPRIAGLLDQAVQRRANVVVSGGTGSGKTTTLGAMAGMAASRDRIVVIEDTSELRISQPHVARLEARPPSLEGSGAVTIRDLVRNALRMRPDRIVVGEVRGGEALVMVMAMTTGHDGCLSTIHASSPQAALRRLGTLCLMSGVPLPHDAVGALIGDAIDLIVHQERGSGGQRAVTSVSVVAPGDEGPVAREIEGADLPELRR